MVDLLLDGDRPRRNVDVLTLETEQLTEPQRAVGGDCSIQPARRFLPDRSVYGSIAIACRTASSTSRATTML